VIDAEKANYKISWMCALLGVPRSSFYAWRNRAETATAARAASWPPRCAGSSIRGGVLTAAGGSRRS
jgi:hypothetical protein